MCIRDRNNINFSLERNGAKVQIGNTNKMLWKIDELISYVSTFFTLKIGDILFTGTPSGVGNIYKNDNLRGYLERKIAFSINIK